MNMKFAKTITFACFLFVFFNETASAESLSGRATHDIDFSFQAPSQSILFNYITTPNLVAGEVKENFRLATFNLSPVSDSGASVVKLGIAWDADAPYMVVDSGAGTVAHLKNLGVSDDAAPLHVFLDFDKPATPIEVNGAIYNTQDLLTGEKMQGSIRVFRDQLATPGIYRATLLTAIINP
ncbi:hypothetical protein SAMN05192562_11329 [Kosakonia arachidis]|uniref:CS1 type fimbrial major subunit n=2 Tax=Kosakonia arachidis TaxID=551989 RepID=A0A1I7E9X9_9ENTR|nr:hypothetical protein SAMN05192562_11329 [Kosakonia arachidis]